MIAFISFIFQEDQITVEGKIVGCPPESNISIPIYRQEMISEYRTNVIFLPFQIRIESLIIGCITDYWIKGIPGTRK